MISELLYGAGLKGHAFAYELCGCGVDDPLRPMYPRIGNKFKLRNMIVPLIPEHTKYVEPFAGSSAIFFAKPKAEQNVLNDLDKDTIRGLRLLQNAPTDVESYPDLTTRKEHQDYFTHPLKSKQGQIALRIIETADGFFGMKVEKPEGIYKHPSIRRKVRNIAEYKEKLKDVKITSEDYGKVIKANDGAGSFFFLDPPYEESNKRMGYAEHKDFDFERLADILSHIRGKFLMTINDSPRIRELFKSYNIRPFKALTNVSQTNFFVKGKMEHRPYERNELFISNYRLPGR